MEVKDQGWTVDLGRKKIKYYIETIKFSVRKTSQVIATTITALAETVLVISIALGASS